MSRQVAIGIQNFDELIEKKCFYIDKTDFIREWWENNDSVTLIVRWCHCLLVRDVLEKHLI